MVRNKDQHYIMNGLRGVPVLREAEVNNTLAKASIGNRIDTPQGSLLLHSVDGRELSYNGR